MKKAFCFFIGVLILFSCQQTAIDKPDNLIEENTMEDILYDLAVLDAIKTNDPVSLERKKITASTYVYDKYHIDSLQFVSSNHYYASDIHNYLKMYKRVEEKLGKEKTKIDTIIAQKKIKKLEVKKGKDTSIKNPDSIKRRRIDKKVEVVKN